MARPKKNGTYLNVCIETPIYERLENFCKDAGHTKTVTAACAHKTSVDFNKAFPFRIFPPFRFLALILSPGHKPAHDEI